MHYFFTKLFAEASAIYDHGTYIHPDFQTIIDHHEMLDQKLEFVFTSYMSLRSPKDRKIVQNAYHYNNNIEKVCNNAVRPIKFSELPAAIQDPLRDLYGSEGVLYQMLTAKKGNVSVKNRCGSLKGHFERFREENLVSLCPFCGMENLLTDYDDGKNEYDHYLSKRDYPFCSINFNNLAPVCDYCNKAGNKGQKDIPFQPNTNPQIQDELYYPYTTSFPNHVIFLTINAPTINLSDINGWTLSIDCIPATNGRKKERWLEIYNIENRYKSKIVKDSYLWKDRIVRKYSMRCKKNGDSFAKFKDDILDDSMDYLMYNNGILIKYFDEFVMNDPNCEANLIGAI
jgi:hypothetical protein